MLVFFVVTKRLESILVVFKGHDAERVYTVPRVVDEFLELLARQIPIFVTIIKFIEEFAEGVLTPLGYFVGIKSHVFEAEFNIVEDR